MLVTARTPNAKLGTELDRHPAQLSLTLNAWTVMDFRPNAKTAGRSSNSNPPHFK
jgi:hypothetical protein